MKEDDCDKLTELILKNEVSNAEKTEALIYGLLEIEDSINKVYGEIIPKILKDSNLNREKLQDLLWDMREEFRHIEYHIEDADLLSL